MLAAYFDASQRGSGIFSVAGFAFGVARAKSANREWLRLWGDTPCHMTDLHGRYGAFKGWSPEQAGERIQRAVPIITGHASYGVAVSCDLAEIERLAPKDEDAAPGQETYLDWFRRAYVTCCHMAMVSLGTMTKDSGHKSGIGYFFEAGDLHYGEAHRTMGWASRFREIQQMYLYGSHSFLEKSNCRLFEMSDIFAWEWAKHMERTHVQGNPRMRGSLKAILGDGRMSDRDFASRTRRAVHLTGEPLARYFRQAKDLILSSP